MQRNSCKQPTLRKENNMGNSSTQFPFMLAALIAVMIHALVSEPRIDTKKNMNPPADTIQQTNQTIASLLVSAPAKTKQN